MSSTKATVQSVDRALTILDILKDFPRGIGVTELSYKLDVSKSTTHRLLMSLSAKGMVRQDMETEKYQLGLRLIELGQIVSDNLDIRSEASSYLHQLMEVTGETAHLAILEKNDIVYIDKIESPATIRMYSHIGKRGPIHCTGVGKAILAYLPEQRIRNILAEKGMKKYTKNTITDIEEMIKHLNGIRSRGYSIDNEEHEYGIKCAAAPILNYQGEVIAGISVAGPIMRVTPDKLEYIADHVMEVTNRLSELIGRKKIL